MRKQDRKLIVEIKTNFAEVVAPCPICGEEFKASPGLAVFEMTSDKPICESCVDGHGLALLRWFRDGARSRLRWGGERRPLFAVEDDAEFDSAEICRIETSGFAVHRSVATIIHLEYFTGHSEFSDERHSCVRQGSGRGRTGCDDRRGTEGPCAGDLHLGYCGR